MPMSARTFNLTLKDAEFVVGELPPSDGFTQDLQQWVDEERARAEDERIEYEKRWALIEPAWNRFLWRAVGARDAST